jgi:hypothetical protein
LLDGIIGALGAGIFSVVQGIAGLFEGIGAAGEGAAAEGGATAAEGAAETGGELSTDQAANLARFEKKLPGNPQPTKVTDLPDGGKVFEADVPAQNIPGSYARYEKTIDAEGNTVSYRKITYAPDGSVVSVKIKYP